eukprot:2745868-Amphidinium_carterae.1
MEQQAARRTGIRARSHKKPEAHLSYAAFTERCLNCFMLAWNVSASSPSSSPVFSIVTPSHG